VCCRSSAGFRPVRELPNEDVAALAAAPSTIRHALGLTGYASIAVALCHNGRDPTGPLVLLGMATA
jgi:hypothetical protein